MADRMMLAETAQGTISPEGVGVVDRALAGARPDVIHQDFGRYRLHHLGVDPALSLEETEDHTLAGSAPAAFAFATATEIGLVQFDLPFELAALQFTQMKQCFPQALVDPADHLDVQPQVTGQPVGRLQLVKPLQDRNLTTKPREALRLTAVAAFDVATCGAQHFERPTKNTLATPQKVGRTAEMTVFPNCQVSRMEPV